VNILVELKLFPILRFYYLRHHCYAETLLIHVAELDANTFICASLFTSMSFGQGSDFFVEARGDGFGGVAPVFGKFQPCVLCLLISQNELCFEGKGQL
jgi:hypothetical protein